MAVVKWVEVRTPRDRRRQWNANCYLASYINRLGRLRLINSSSQVRTWTRSKYTMGAPYQGLIPINFRLFRLLKSFYRRRRLGVQATFQLVTLGALAFLGASAGALVFLFDGPQSLANGRGCVQFTTRARAILRRVNFSRQFREFPRLQRARKGRSI
jgi:hypothetical protein